jgi:hypothetical protein
MDDFDPHKFTAGAFIAGVAMTSVMMASVRSPASLIDEQRLIDHEILRSQIARTKSRAARHVAEAALASLDASASLRLAAASARTLHR